MNVIAAVLIRSSLNEVKQFLWPPYVIG